MNDRIFSVWTVYRNPHDYPLHYVARRYEIMPYHGEPEATDDIIMARDLDMVRRALQLRGLSVQPRAWRSLPYDKGQIVESWI